MIVALDQLSPSQTYFTMIQALIPRPIAWVLSENEGGGLNLAPFSYFTPVASDPPLLVLSVGKRPDGSPKDTRVNIEQRGAFVVHIAHRELLDALNDSSASLPPGVSEVERLGLETVAESGWPLPRLRACRVACACQRERIIEIGRVPQALIVGRVTQIYVDDAIAERDDAGRLVVDAAGLDPLGRLGAGQYVTFGERVERRRPR